GGFLVEVTKRLRIRLKEQIAAGSDLSRQDWLNSIAETINGVEIQYFSRYLAELNLLVQLGHLLVEEPRIGIPPIGVVAGDTLKLCQPLAGEHVEFLTD